MIFREAFRDGLVEDSFLDHKKLEETSIEDLQEAILPLNSAHQFKDMCVAFNIDSLKKSQRGLIIFDNTNKDKERCVACPNPQMSKRWEETECGIMWLHQINTFEELGSYQNCYY